jgi:glycosyltransferase involved in cell wall biosynthesis
MTSNNPMVSVVIIFLNGEQFISESIESVLAQTYQNWELFLVDDGSNDGSTDTARQYTASYPDKVRYLEHVGHDNLGMSPSRNLGIRNGKGEYVAFLDADDVWLPQKLERQVYLLESHPEVGMVYGPTLVWYSWTGSPADARQEHVAKIRVSPGTVWMPPHLLSLYLAQKARNPSPGSLLVRRSLVDQIGGFEESFRGLHEDQAFLAKVCLAAPVLVDGEVLDKYRQHPRSCTATAQEAGQVNAAVLVYMNWLAGYLGQHGFRGTEVWRELRKAKWRHKHPLVTALKRQSRSRVGQLRGVLGKFRASM